MNPNGYFDLRIGLIASAVLLSKLGESMVASSADIVIQNRRISLSETYARTIRDVVNIIRCFMHWLAAIKTPLQPVF